MNWKSKKILITGAGGFMGSHLTERLIQLGAQVKAFVRYNSRNNAGSIELLSPVVKKDIEIIYGDVRELETVLNAMRKVDIVFHLAALVGIPYSYLHPQEVVETNTIGTLNILSASKAEDVQKIVHTSTSEVYGTAQYIPIDERHPLQAQSPYAGSKIAADAIAMSFHNSFGLPVAIIRPFNAYGPRQSARAVIPTIIAQALTKDEIFFGSLTPTRDFTYVKDTVEGFVKIAESQNSVGEVINIGSGYEISIKNLVEKITSIIGRKVELRQDSKRIRPSKSEVERLCADNTKAQRLVNWRPKTALAEGLKETIDWTSRSLDLYEPEVYKV